MGNSKSGYKSDKVKYRYSEGGKGANLLIYEDLLTFKLLESEMEGALILYAFNKKKEFHPGIRTIKKNIFPDRKEYLLYSNLRNRSMFGIYEDRELQRLLEIAEPIIDVNSRSKYSITNIRFLPNYTEGRWKFA